MEALKADVTQGLEKGSLVTCADNTGARQLKVISVAGYSGSPSSMKCIRAWTAAHGKRCRW